MILAFDRIRAASTFGRLIERAFGHLLTSSTWIELYHFEYQPPERFGLNGTVGVVGLEYAHSRLPLRFDRIWLDENFPMSPWKSRRQTESDRDIQ